MGDVAEDQPPEAAEAAEGDTAAPDAEAPAPAADEPVADGEAAPAAEEAPPVEDPPADGEAAAAATEEPAGEEATVDEPAAVEPAAEDPTAEAPPADEPAAEEPPAVEPAADGAGTAEPAEAPSQSQGGEEPVAVANEEATTAEGETAVAAEDPSDPAPARSRKESQAQKENEADAGAGANAVDQSEESMWADFDQSPGRQPEQAGSYRDMEMERAGGYRQQEMQMDMERQRSIRPEPAAVNLDLEKRLNEALARLHIVEDDRNHMEAQVRELRLKADMEAQARQQAEKARETAEEELRYRLTVQGKAENKSHGQIVQLEATIRELQAQIEELQDQERLVGDLQDRVYKAEREIKDKDAQFERIQSEMERRLQQQQQLLVKNRMYMESVGRRKFAVSNTLQNALGEMRSKRKETDDIAGTLENLLKRMDRFMSEEASRVKELSDVKDSLLGLKIGNIPNLEALEQLDVQLRQERDNAHYEFMSERKLEDELLGQLAPKMAGGQPAIGFPGMDAHMGQGDMMGMDGNFGGGGFGRNFAGMPGAENMNMHQAPQGFGAFDMNMGGPTMFGGVGGGVGGGMGPGMGGAMGPYGGGAMGPGGGAWPMAAPAYPRGSYENDAQARSVNASFDLPPMPYGGPGADAYGGGPLPPPGQADANGNPQRSERRRSQDNVKFPKIEQDKGAVDPKGGPRERRLRNKAPDLPKDPKGALKEQRQKELQKEAEKRRGMRG